MKTTRPAIFDWKDRHTHINLSGAYNVRMIKWVTTPRSCWQSERGRRLLIALSAFWGKTLGKVLAPERIGIIAAALDADSYNDYVRRHLQYKTISVDEAAQKSKRELLRRRLLIDELLIQRPGDEKGEWLPLNLKGINFSNKYLSGLPFKMIDCAGANFSGALLTGTYFSHSNASGVDFSRAIGLELYRSKYTGANFDGSRGFVVDGINKGLPILAEGEALRDDLKNIMAALAAPKVVARFQTDFSAPDLLYPGEAWGIEEIEEEEVDFATTLTGSKGLLCYLDFHFLYLVKDKWSVLEIERDELHSLSLSDTSLAPPLVYKVEVSGGLSEPKSLSGDFLVVDGSEKIPLADFLDQKFQIKTNPRKGFNNILTVEVSGQIVRLETGEFVPATSSVLKITIVKEGKLESYGIHRNPLSPAKEEDDASNVIFSYHSHPTDLPPVLSPGDIGAFEHKREDGQPLPELVFNSKGQGRLYLLKRGRSWEDAYADLSKFYSAPSVMGRINAGLVSAKGSMEARRWQEKLIQYFDVIELNFSSDGRMESNI